MKSFLGIETKAFMFLKNFLKRNALFYKSHLSLFFIFELFSQKLQIWYKKYESLFSFQVLLLSSKKIFICFIYKRGIYFIQVSVDDTYVCVNAGQSTDELKSVMDMRWKSLTTSKTELINFSRKP